MIDAHFAVYDMTGVSPCIGWLRFIGSGFTRRRRGFHPIILVAFYWVRVRLKEYIYNLKCVSTIFSKERYKVLSFVSYTVCG